MQTVKPAFDHYSLQYYVITPRDRVRLATLLAPLPARESEHLFKAIMNKSFMASDMKETGIMSRIRFCAFRHALAIVRATPDGPHGRIDDTAAVEKHQQRLEKYVDHIRNYNVAYADALYPLEEKHLKRAEGPHTATPNFYRTICDLLASQLARHKAGIQHRSPSELKEIEDSLHEFKYNLINECAPYHHLKNALPKRGRPTTFLQHLKPW